MCLSTWLLPNRPRALCFWNGHGPGNPEPPASGEMDDNSLSPEACYECKINGYPKRGRKRRSANETDASNIEDQPEIEANVSLASWDVEKTAVFAFNISHISNKVRILELLPALTTLTNHNRYLIESGNENGFFKINQRKGSATSTSQRRSQWLEPIHYKSVVLHFIKRKNLIS